MFYKTGIFKTLAKMHRKTSVLKLPFKRVKGSNFIKKRLQHLDFSVNFAKYLTTPIFKERVKTTAFMQPVFSESTHLLRVSFDTVTSIKNATIFLILPYVSIQFFKLLKGMEFVNRIHQGTIIRTGITCKKILYKSLLNSAWI